MGKVETIIWFGLWAFLLSTPLLGYLEEVIPQWYSDWNWRRHQRRHERSREESRQWSARIAAQEQDERRRRQRRARAQAWAETVRSFGCPFYENPYYHETNVPTALSIRSGIKELGVKDMGHAAGTHERLREREIRDELDRWWWDAVRLLKTHQIICLGFRFEQTERDRCKRILQSNSYRVAGDYQSQHGCLLYVFDEGWDPQKVGCIPAPKTLKGSVILPEQAAIRTVAA